MASVIANPKPLVRRLKKPKRIQRAVAHTAHGSKHRSKDAQRPARLHRANTNERANTLHQVTTKLAKTKSVIVMKDLHVAGILKNHHLAQAVVDVGLW
jgi:putative transposase